MYKTIETIKKAGGGGGGGGGAGLGGEEDILIYRLSIAS